MKRLLALVLCVVMVFALAACGGAASSSAPAPASTPASTAPASTAPASTPADDGGDAPVGTVQGVTDTEIIVANSAATSGAYAAVGTPFNAGIEVYFDMVNAAGGIDGRTIRFEHYQDDEGDPAKGKAALEGIVEDLEAFALVGHFYTPVVAATLEDIKTYGIPAVYFATGISQLYATGATTNEEGYNIFPVQPVYNTEGRMFVAYAQNMFQAAKIGVIYTNDDAGMGLLAGIEEQAAALGIEVVSQQVTAGSADVSAAVAGIKEAGVDATIVAAIQATFPTIVKELAAQGVNVPAITTYSNADASQSSAILADITGKFDVYVTGWLASGEAALADYTVFATEIMKKYPDYVANAFAMAGWVAAATFTEGLRRVEGEELTWESYMAALEEAPIVLPFSAEVDYANGNRWGTQSMTLSKAVAVSEEFPLGWQEVSPMTDMNVLLG